MSDQVYLPGGQSQIQIHNDQLGRTEIYGIDVRLEPSTVAKDRDLTIWADHLTISGVIQMPSRKVNLWARSITLESKATIDVSGIDGESHEAGDKKDGQARGESGADGSTGGDGRDAGDVFVLARLCTGSAVLKANGGEGGRGKDGGNGKKGIQPEPAKDADKHYSSTGIHAGKQGAKGGKGGNAGRAGRSGSGGSAGVAVAGIVAGVVEITGETRGGNPGPAASHGKPGKGGDGGLGGYSTSCVWMDDGGVLDRTHRWVSCTRIGRSSSGKDGAKGNEVSAPPEIGAAGSNGNFDNSVCTLEELEATVPRAFVELLHREGELAYYNNNLKRASEIFEFVCAIAAAADEPSSQRAELLTHAFGVNQSDEIGDLGDAAASLLRQIMCGLDYFGNSTNWVTLVSYDLIAQKTNQTLTLCDQINTRAKLLELQSLGESERRSQLVAAVEDGREALKYLQQAIDKKVLELNEVERGIDRLVDAEGQLEQEIFTANAAFRDAVEKQSNNCGFVDVLKAVGTIVQISYGGFTAIKAGLEGVEDAADLLKKKGSFERNKKLIGVIKTTAGRFEDVANAYADIKEIISPESPHLAKLVIAEQEVAKLTEPYMNLAEAGDLRESVQAYLDAVKARNALIMGYNELSSDIDAMKSEKYRQESSLARAEDAVIRLGQAGTVQQLAFAQGLLHDSLKTIGRLLYLEHRALEYLRLGTSPLALAGYSHEAFAYRQICIQREHIDALDEFGRGQSEFSRLGVTFDKNNREHLLKLLKKDGVITFSLGVDHKDVASAFRFLAQVLVSHVNVRLLGLKGDSRRCRVVCDHHGDSAIISPAGTRVDYRHRPLRAVFEFDTKTLECASELDGGLGYREGEYAAISPFATWTIDVRGSGVRYDDIEKINISFRGFYRPLLNAIPEYPIASEANVLVDHTLSMMP